MTIEIERLRELLDYDPETGILTWLERAEGPAWWNTRFAGKPAGCVGGDGYLNVQVDGRCYRAHRVAWAIHNGRWPDGEIDHVSGEKLDNRAANLRDVPHRVNARNQKMRVTNRSGYTGVSWHKATGRWQALIRINGKKLHLGLFDNIADAVAARRAADRQHGYTDRHGKAQM